jgi:hypothetical protein
MPIDVRPKFLKRFYESLVILHVLGKNRGVHLKEDDDELYEIDLTSTKLRRAFVRNIAYLCDYQKGGDSMTAIALEQDSDEVVFWLAVNVSVYS